MLIAICLIIIIIQIFWLISVLKTKKNFQNDDELNIEYKPVKGVTQFIEPVNTKEAFDKAETINDFIDNLQ